MPSYRIMIIEDDPTISALLSELLSAMRHFPCAFATSEAEAPEVAERANPDLVLADIRLGEGSGVAAVEKICRERDRPVPHIFITGAVLPPGTLAPGAVILRKPFNEFSLTTAINRAMGRPRSGGARASVTMAQMR